MSTAFANHVSAKVTPQNQIIPGREADMVFNNAKGAVFQLDCFKHLHRFLILGTEGGTYYSSESEHTLQAFDGIKQCITESVQKTVDLIVEISSLGRAANNDYALFALACVLAFAKDNWDKHTARLAVNKVARTGTHILHLAQFVDQLKGWGMGTRKAFQNWYLEKTPDQVAFQAVKYASRDGWSHRDILRKCHPVGSDAQSKVFGYIIKPEIDVSIEGYPRIISAAQYAKKSEVTIPELIQLIELNGLPREALPTEALNDKNIWQALLPGLKPEALIRNLGKLTSLGMLAPMSANTKYVQSILEDAEALKKARIHPFKVLLAQRVYGNGRGVKGSLTWTPTSGITEVLEDAFHKSFNFVEPSGKNILLGLDVSGSMTKGIAGSFVSCYEASAVMALTTVKAEKYCEVMAFSTRFTPLGISKSDNFSSTLKKVSGLAFTATDCSLPMQYAEKSKIEVDCFQVYTDNETYSGEIAPSQALVQYRKAMGKPNAKLAVVGMTATDFSIADPKDLNMVDFVGFDAGAPQAMAEFVKM